MLLDIIIKIVLILLLILVLLTLKEGVNKTEQMNKNLEALLEKEWIIEIE